MELDWPQLGVSPILHRSLLAFGFEKPSPQQKEILPHLLRRGSKTPAVLRTPGASGVAAAYVIRALQLLEEAVRDDSWDIATGSPQVLICTFSRERVGNLLGLIRGLGRVLFDQLNTATTRHQDAYSALTGVAEVPFAECFCAGENAGELDRLDFARAAAISRGGCFLIVCTPDELLRWQAHVDMDITSKSLQVVSVEQPEQMSQAQLSSVQQILLQTAHRSQVILTSQTPTREAMMDLRKFLVQPEDTARPMLGDVFEPPAHSEQDLAMKNSKFYYVDVDEESYKLETLKDLLEHAVRDDHDCRIVFTCVFFSTRRKARFVADMLTPSLILPTVVVDDQADHQQVAADVFHGEIKCLFLSDGFPMELSSSLARQRILCINYDVPFSLSTLRRRLALFQSARKAVVSSFVCGKGHAEPAQRFGHSHGDPVLKELEDELLEPMTELPLRFLEDL